MKNKLLVFFLNDWQPKSYVATQYTEDNVAVNPTATITVDMANAVTKIPVTILVITLING